MAWTIPKVITDVQSFINHINTQDKMDVCLLFIDMFMLMGVTFDPG